MFENLSVEEKERKLQRIKEALKKKVIEDKKLKEQQEKEKARLNKRIPLWQRTYVTALVDENQTNKNQSQKNLIIPFLQLPQQSQEDNIQKSPRTFRNAMSTSNNYRQNSNLLFANNSKQQQQNPPLLLTPQLPSDNNNNNEEEGPLNKFKPRKSVLLAQPIIPDQLQNNNNNNSSKNQNNKKLQPRKSHILMPTYNGQVLTKSGHIIQTDDNKTQQENMLHVNNLLNLIPQTPTKDKQNSLICDFMQNSDQKRKSMGNSMNSSRRSNQSIVPELQQQDNKIPSLKNLEKRSSKKRETHISLADINYYDEKDVSPKDMIEYNKIIYKDQIKQIRDQEDLSNQIKIYENKAQSFSPNQKPSQLLLRKQSSNKSVVKPLKVLSSRESNTQSESQLKLLMKKKQINKPNDPIKIKIQEFNKNTTQTTRETVQTQNYEIKTTDQSIQETKNQQITTQKNSEYFSKQSRENDNNNAIKHVKNRIRTQNSVNKSEDEEKSITSNSHSVKSSYQKPRYLVLKQTYYSNNSGSKNNFGRKLMPVPRLKVVNQYERMDSLNTNNSSREKSHSKSSRGNSMLNRGEHLRTEPSLYNESDYLVNTNVDKDLQKIWKKVEKKVLKVQKKKQSLNINDNYFSTSTYKSHQRILTEPNLASLRTGQKPITSQENQRSKLTQESDYSHHHHQRFNTETSVESNQNNNNNNMLDSKNSIKTKFNTKKEITIDTLAANEKYQNQVQEFNQFKKQLKKQLTRSTKNQIKISTQSLNQFQFQQTTMIPKKLLNPNTSPKDSSTQNFNSTAKSGIGKWVQKNSHIAASDKKKYDLYLLCKNNKEKHSATIHQEKQNNGNNNNNINDRRSSKQSSRNSRNNSNKKKKQSQKGHRRVQTKPQIPTCYQDPIISPQYSQQQFLVSPHSVKGFKSQRQIFTPQENKKFII